MKPIVYLSVLLLITFLCIDVQADDTAGHDQPHEHHDKDHLAESMEEEEVSLR